MRTGPRWRFGSHRWAHGSCISAVDCLHCGPVIAIPRNTKDGGVLYCRACHGQLGLHRVADPFEAVVAGMADDPLNLELRANEDAAENILAQIP